MLSTDKIKNIIEASIQTKQSLLGDEGFMHRIQSSVDLITEAFKGGHKLWLCGNGGSAADAQHLAAEFTGRFYKDRPALAAEALHVNTSYLTSVGNDYGFDFIYSRLLEGVGTSGDILIALSTSGNSKNIINAIEMARSKGMIVISFAGADGGRMKEGSDVLLNVPSYDTPRIQEAHIMVGHIICELVEEAYFHA